MAAGSTLYCVVRTEYNTVVTRCSVSFVSAVLIVIADTDCALPDGDA